MIIERKGRGKELDKLFEIAIMYMKNDKELDLYEMIKKHPDLLNWTMDKHGGACLLYIACEMNKISILDTLLLPLHVNENLKGDDGQTPLIVACVKGHTDCVSVLLGPLIRANVNAVANHGDTALHVASQCNSASCIPLLIDGGADVNAVNDEGFTALHIASQCNSASCIPLLIDSGADVNAVTNEGFTALHIASFKNSASCIPLLMDGGADVNAVSNEGFTALHIASQFNSASCIPLLIDGGADVNVVNNDGFTALHTASYCNSLESVLSLTASGADTTMVSGGGKTALDLARGKGHTAIVDLLTK